jgi:hypothetical protein
MQNQIIPIHSHNTFKNLVFLGQSLYVAGGWFKQDTNEKIVANSKKNYWIGGVIVIPVQNIIALSYTDDDTFIDIEYLTATHKKKSLRLGLPSLDVVLLFCMYVTAQGKFFKEEREASVFWKIRLPLSMLIMAFFAFGFCYYLATEPTRETTNIKEQILMWIITNITDYITPNGWLVAGVIGVLWSSYEIVQRFDKSVTKYTYTLDKAHSNISM